MLKKTNQIVLPELIGQRVRHRKSGFGNGIIDWAWLNESGIACITVVFDSNSECKDFDLLKCYKPRFLTFEDTSITYEKLLAIINKNQQPREIIQTEPQPKTVAKKAPTNPLDESANKPQKEPNKNTINKQTTKKGTTKKNPPISDQEIAELFGLTSAIEPKETLTPEQQQAEKEAIYTYLTQERGVQQFVHFTPEKNLLSILKHGILPRTELKLQNIDAITPDPDRFDFQLNYSSLSISFPNYLIFYNKRNCMPETPFVILCIDPKIILDLPLRDISYLPDNAASRTIKNVMHFTGCEAAKGLFSEQATVRGITHQRDELSLPNNYPTNPQAEVFLRGAIQTEYITAIHTENSEQNATVRAILPQNLTKKISIYTKSNLFLPRIDHRMWLKPVKAENGAENGETTSILQK